MPTGGPSSPTEIERAGDLEIARCQTVTCDAVTITPYASPDTCGRAPSIAIGTDGLPVISYLNTTTGDLKVLACGSVTCSPPVRSG